MRGQISFAAASVAQFDRGHPVSLRDGRTGFVMGRRFSITPGGAPQLDGYRVMLCGGQGHACVKPDQLDERQNTAGAA